MKSHIEHTHNSHVTVANKPLCVVAIGILVVDLDVKDFDDVGNVVPAVMTPEREVVSTGADFTTRAMQPRCES